MNRGMVKIDMNQSGVQLLDLPDEILLIILRKLNNIDVLYSLWNINDRRLHILTKEKTFSDTLDFVSIGNIHSIDRFCYDILPTIHDNVKYLILKPVLMERILLASKYPNLTKLKLFNFKMDTVVQYLKNESPLRFIFQQQITELILENHDRRLGVGSSKGYTVNLYACILNVFEKLKHFSITERFNMSYPALTVSNLSSTTFSSSILTQLCIDVSTLDDCLYILDGRLKQLTTLTVRIHFIDDSSTIVHKMDDLPNLKYFSLKYYDELTSYDNRIVPLLRRMSYLEKLTLYLQIIDRNRFVDNADLENEILVYMSHLHTFTFYIRTYIDAGGIRNDFSIEDVQQPFTHNRQQHVVRVVNNINYEKIVFSIFSTPFTFDRLVDIGNQLPNITFSYVRYLRVEDVFPFDRRFFIQIAQAFPLLRTLRIANYDSDAICDLDNNQSYEMAKYPHLISLHMLSAHESYLEQFLNERKAYVPCLTKLKVAPHVLASVTNHFTRQETRRNCMKIKQLHMVIPLVHSKDFYLYFPLL